jgi:hypothetical protein
MSRRAAVAKDFRHVGAALTVGSALSGFFKSHVALVAAATGAVLGIVIWAVAIALTQEGDE